MGIRSRTERGSASVEQVGLAALFALIAVAVAAALLAGGEVDDRHALARAIGRRIACAPRLPEPCRHHPLIPAYGWPIARLVRSLAPTPTAVTGPGGLPLMPVDFRRCRRESCAVGYGPHLTTSGRRTAAFVELEDRRRSTGTIEITYWLYRPTIGWEAVHRRATQADVAAASGTRVLLRDDPNLVPLETLAGRDQFDFPPGERPPWRWQVGGLHPGWST